MTRLAKTFPIVPIPEFGLVAAVWFDVIDPRCGLCHALAQVLGTKGVLAKKPLAGPLPSSAITPGGGARPRVCRTA